MKIGKNRKNAAGTDERCDELQNSLQRISENITENKKQRSASGSVFKRYSIWPRLLSLIAAFFLWLYVFQAVDIEKTISDVPIRMSGFDTSLDLDIASNYLSSVSLTVSGTNSAIKELNAEDIVVSVDMSLVNTVGHYSLPLQVESLPKNVTLIKMAPETIDIVVDKTVTREIAVETELSYTIRDPYELGEMTLEPLAVTVKGPESDIRAIDRAVLETDLSDLRHDITAKGTVRLYDINGYEISSPYIVVTPSTVSLSLPVNLKVKLPVTPSMSFDESRFDVSLDMSSITVFGAVSLLEDLKEITTQPVEITAAGSYTLTLNLPEGVSAYRSNVFDESNLITSVTVTVSEKPAEPEEPAEPDEV